MLNSLVYVLFRLFHKLKFCYPNRKLSKCYERKLYYAIEIIFTKYAIANHIPWKQIPQRIHCCNLSGNGWIFDKVIEKIQRVPNFITDGVILRSYVYIISSYLRRRMRLCFRCGFFVCMSVCVYVCMSVRGITRRIVNCNFSTVVV